MIGDIIKYRIKLVNLKGQIAVGIGLRNVLKNNDFLWKSGEYDKHGFYIVESNSYSYSYMDK